MARKEGIGRRRHRSEAKGNPSRVDGSRRPDPYKATWSGGWFSRRRGRQTMSAIGTERRIETALKVCVRARDMTPARERIPNACERLAESPWRHVTAARTAMSIAPPARP